MSWLTDFFKGASGGNNPADAAMPYLNQIPGMEKGYYDPYINRGNEAGNRLTPQFNQMSSDPSAFLESIMKNYTPSRGYQLSHDEALRAAGNTAAAGGMRGSLSDIENESRLTDVLMGNDMQQWLQNVLGIQKEGTAGLTHQFDTGFDATKGLTGDLSNVLGTQSQLAFQGERENNQRKSDLLSSLLGFGGAALGFL